MMNKLKLLYMIKFWAFIVFHSQAGNTFIIQNQAQFWYELLPVYYKHNNMSSFVRQLNMYGFHKISSLENTGGAYGTEKDDMNVIQFYHPYFQKDKPEKLKNIKRKVTNSKPPSDVHTSLRTDDMSKVLSDVKQLRGRQNSVDSQLVAMKQENSVLWKELTLLRERHMKQQQIVNKLIQFLVTLVQPTTPSRMGVGVKRRMPLMLHESPLKKSRMRKNSSGRHSTDGPTIHELDPEDLSAEQLLEEASEMEEELPMETAVAHMEKRKKVNSPVTPTPQISQGSPIQQNHAAQNEVAANQQKSINPDPSFWDKPEFVSLEDVNDDISETEEELINSLQKNAGGTEKVFINPDNRDTLIGNLVGSGSYNVNAVGGKTIVNGKKQPNNKVTPQQSPESNMQVATKYPPVKISSGEDLDLHVDNTQAELDQLKDILNGCNTFDANSLLGLFTDNDPDYEVRNTLQNKENSTTEGADPLVSGNELAPASTLIDFNELFDDDLTNQDTNSLTTSSITPAQNSGLETPIIIKDESSPRRK